MVVVLILLFQWITKIMNNSVNDLKVLIVEDEPKLASLLRDTVSSYCYSVTVATNGQEGIEKFLKVKPDIIITDIMMPILDGLEMTIQIKEYDSEIPIIVLSAFGDQEKLLKAIDVGINKYFIKPYDPDELIEHILKLVSKMINNKTIQLNSDFSYNINTKNLYKNEKIVKLTKRDKIFLELLIANANTVLVFDKIKSNLWINEEVSDERIRTFVRRFRTKCSKELIKNVSGQGYILSINDI